MSIIAHIWNFQSICTLCNKDHFLSIQIKAAMDALLIVIYLRFSVSENVFSN